MATVVLNALTALCHLATTAEMTTGCTDPAALGYKSASRSDDGTCTYSKAHLLQALGNLSEKSTCYVYNETVKRWPDMPQNANLGRAGHSETWVVQGKPGKGELPCVPLAAKLLAMHFDVQSQSRLFLRYVSIHAKGTQDKGGIIFVQHSTVLIWGVDFAPVRNARYARWGGVVYAQDSAVTVHRTRFRRTTAVNAGGSIYVESGPGLTVVHSLFHGVQSLGTAQTLSLDTSGGGAPSGLRR